MTQDEEEDKKRIEEVVRNLSEKLGGPVTYKKGWFVLPPTGRVVTSEMIRQIEDYLDREDVERANAFARGELP